MAISPAELTRRSYIDWAVEMYNQLGEEYQKYDDYYVGEHVLAYATERWVQTFGDTFENFADNWAAVVADTHAQRMEIIGWQSDDDKEAAKVAEQIWDEKEVEQEEEDLHLQTLVKGDGFLMVWPDPADDEWPDIYFNDALDINVHYDPANKRKIIRASKRWFDENGQLNLYIYYPDKIEKFIVPKEDNPNYSLLSPQVVPMDDYVMPKGWRRNGTIDNPYDRVPVFHFRNRPSGSTHGISELKAVIPVQNAVNKVLMDTMIASEFGGYRQKWMAGGGHPPNGWGAGPERMWATTDPNARFGQFDQTDLDPFTHFIEMMVGHIAKITQTPMHYLRASGDMPSGEALKVAESGLVSKAKASAKRWRSPWGQSMTFAVELKTKKRPKSPVYPVWRSPETRHDLEQAQTAQLKSILGVPLEQLWSEHFGYSEEQINKFKKDNRAVGANVIASVLAQTGQVPPGMDELGLGPDALDALLKASQGGGAGGTEALAGLEGLNASQILALLSRSETSQTTAGEATVRPQPNTRPPASPTRRSRGFKD